MYAFHLFLLSDKFPIINDIIALQLNQAAFSEIEIQPRARVFEGKPSMVIAHASCSQIHI